MYVVLSPLRELSGMPSIQPELTAGRSFCVSVRGAGEKSNTPSVWAVSGDDIESASRAASPGRGVGGTAAVLAPLERTNTRRPH